MKHKKPTILVVDDGEYGRRKELILKYLRGELTMRVINYKNNSCIWYHTTPLERVETILREGLKINSEPTWQSSSEPWIYLSVEPWLPESKEPYTVLEVDLSFLHTNDCGWPFVDPTNDAEWDGRWQLRVFKDIPPEYIKVMSMKSLEVENV
jgi:hypothetical protein